MVGPRCRNEAVEQKSYRFQYTFRIESDRVLNYKIVYLKFDSFELYFGLNTELYSVLASVVNQSALNRQKVRH